LKNFENFALPEEDISTLIAAFISTVTKYYSSYVAVPFLRKMTKIKKKKLFQSKAKYSSKNCFISLFSTIIYTINNNKH
jgi:hypothetical protein